MQPFMAVSDSQPTTIVIFGASGDLTHRKLIPALYNNYRKGRLPKQLRIVGYARRPYDDEGFRARLRDGARDLAGETVDPKTWLPFAQLVHYYQGNLEMETDYRKLHQFLQELEGEPAHRLYYLATAPEFSGAICEHLNATGMATQENGERRIVIEKPFGHDLASAQDLNRQVQAVFAESQIYRIDHYLGKETSQNILFFRFANTIFETVWNRRYIDCVQITVAEQVDVGHRAGYYDDSGVLRDMFQNHLLQLLSLVAMEPPASFNADAVRDEKVKVFSAIRPIDLADTVRAQYQGYRQAHGVAPGSATPTYAALKLFIDNWRWKGVPFYVRSGKALAQKTSEISIVFQEPPHMMFQLPADYEFTPNILSLCIQPDEGIHLKFETKVPDSVQQTRSVDMGFLYRSSFGDRTLPDAYERLLMDVLQGDASLFTRSDSIDQAWRLIDSVVAGWNTPDAPPLVSYAPGSWGPAEGDELVQRDGHRWRLGCGGNGATGR